MLAYVGSMLALCWPMLALSWPMLALSWPYVGPTLAYVGPMLAHLGAYVEAMLAICETISVERLPRCKFFVIFPSRTPPPQNQKPRKNNGFFYFRQQKNRIGRGYETQWKTMFLWPHTHTRNTVNYRSFGRHGMNRGWVGGGAGSAYKLRCNGLRGRRQDWPRWAKHMLRDQSQTGNPQRQQWVQGFGTQEPQHAHMMP